MTVRQMDGLGTVSDGLCQCVLPAFGPLGLDQVLDSTTNKVVITNSGSTILQSLSNAHPGARALISAVCLHSDRTGDGATGLLIVAAAAIRELERAAGRFSYGCTANVAAATAALAREFSCLPQILKPWLASQSVEVPALPIDFTMPDSLLSTAADALVRTMCSGKVGGDVANHLCALMQSWLSVMKGLDDPAVTFSVPIKKPQATAGKLFFKSNGEI